MKKKVLTAAAASMALAMSLTACGGSASSAAPAASSAAPAPAASSAAAAPAASSEAAAPAAEGALENSYYKGKNVTLYCGFSAGGGSDVLCRLLSARMSQTLECNVTVENLTGASGWVCWKQMLESTPADGLTFFMINSPNVTTGKYDAANTMPYDQTDMELICNQVTDSSCIAIRADETAYTDFESFAEFWKQEGVLMTSASANGITSDDATIAMQLAQDLGCEVDIVPSKGASENATFLLNGTTDFETGNVSEIAPAHYEGTAKVICVFAEERDPALPDVPTYNELTGHMVTGCSSRGYAMLKDCPDEAKTQLKAAVKEAVNNEEVIAQLDAIYTSTMFIEGDEYANELARQQKVACETWGVEYKG